MIVRQQNTTTFPILLFLALSTDGRTGATGKTPTAKISKNGGAPVTASGAFSEISAVDMPGWYSWAGHATDRDTLGELAALITASGVDPLPIKILIVPWNPEGAAGDPFGGAVKIQGQVKKNTALNNFPFLMVLSTNHVTPATGLTVTAERSIDGAAFAPTSNSPTEIGNGVYKINLTAADLNGDTIVLKFTAATADQRTIILTTITP